MKRDRLKELWLNRPWVYIPDVVRCMWEDPYDKKRYFFRKWLRNCLICCWKVAFK